MKLYYLFTAHWDLLPFELYKDKLVILACINNPGNPLAYQIIRDYKIEYRGATYMIVLYNLIPEDFTHLNLLGIPVKPNEVYKNIQLEHAIIRNDLFISQQNLFKDIHLT